MTAADAAGRRLRRWCAVAFGLSLLALPPLWVGAHLDAPAHPGEAERLAQALRGDAATGPAPTLVGRWFLTAAVPGAVWPEAVAAQQQLLGAARLAQVVGTAALAGGVYLTVLLARGRLPALLAAAALLAAPAVGAAGHVLRPETAAALFSVLALLLAQSLAQLARTAVPMVRRRRVLVLWAAAGCLALVCGLGLTAQPDSATPLLLPGVLCSLCAAQLGARTVRLWRRRGLRQLPVRALNQRLWPWTAATLLAPLCAAVLLRRSLPPGTGETVAVAGALVPLWPGAGLGQAAVVGLVLLGGGFLVLRSGLRFGRTGRLGADVVLLGYCAVQLADGTAAAGQRDVLAAAPALAMLLAEGVFRGLGLLRWRLRRGR